MRWLSESSLEKAKALELRLKKAKKPSQKKQVLKQLYIVNGLLFFYFEDLKEDRIDTMKSYKNLNKIIAAHKAKFKKYSKAYAKWRLSKLKKQQHYINLYHSLIRIVEKLITLKVCNLFKSIYRNTLKEELIHYCVS